MNVITTLDVFKMKRVKIQLDTALHVIRYAYVFVFVHVLQVVVRATLERHVFFCLNMLYGCDDSNGNAHMPDWCVIHLRCRSGGEGTIFYSIGRSVAMTKTFPKVCTVQFFHFENEFFSLVCLLSNSD